MRACGYKAFGVRLCKHILVVVDNTILSIQMDENQFIVCNDKGYDIAYYEEIREMRVTHRMLLWQPNNTYLEYYK